MAKKSIIFSNGEGRVYLSNTDLLSVDDVTNNISASAISASVLSISSLNAPTPRLLNSLNGTFSTFGAANINGALVFNGTTYVTSTLTVSDYSGSPSQGDISGNYLDDTRVVNISNVSAGALPVAYGGTGLQLATNTNYLLKSVKSAGNVTLTALSLNSGSVVASLAGTWSLMSPGDPDVRFYTSGSSGNTFTWTKPAGVRFARVILQGAGGGGGGARIGTSLFAGTGAGAGAFTDVTVDVSNISFATITTGVGGIGGINKLNNIPTNGSAGTVSTFVATAISLSANGGSGGLAGTVGSGLAGGAGGAAMSISNGGYSKSGGAGAPNGAGSAITYYGICGGGWSGGSVTVVPIIQSTNFGYNITSNGVDISNLNFYGPNSSTDLNPDTKAKYGVGGSTTNPSLTNINDTRACEGGNGYVIVISW